MDQLGRIRPIITESDRKEMEKAAKMAQEREERKRATEERLRKNLTPKQYDEWSLNRNKAWARSIENIPYGKYLTPEVSLSSIRKEFQQNITGREAEKEEMLHKAASFIVNGRFRRPLLFVGPPGEGKSCFAKCLASALGYPIKYINVPSLHSPIALCGSERHYENSRIGLLLQSVIDSEVLNVVFVFDEIDKTVNDSKDGSVEAALLALFDPLWNGMFTDRSVLVPVDLSRCIFICTANDISSISAPMLDRMDIIRFDPYSHDQALAIVNQKTIPKVIESSGMKGRVRFAPDVAEAIVSWVNEGSMRDYEKLVEKLVDYAIYIMLNNRRKRYTVTCEDIEKVWPCEKPAPLGFGA